MAAQRRSRLTDSAAVSSLISDGMTVAVGGFINAGHPMSLVRQLIADGKRDLVVVGAASAGLDVDVLVAAGCVAKVVAPYVGAEGFAGIGPAFRKAAQDGAIEVFELDEAHFYAGLRASAQRLPFNPWRAGVGTSIPEVNPAIKEFRDPINDELLLAIPAINIDVCLLHAAIGDQFGNIQHNGTRYGDIALSAAADRTYVSVETVCTTERIRANPAATSISAADGVIRAPFGAHPFSADGFYVPDADHIRTYLEVASHWMRADDRGPLDEYLAGYVHGVSSHGEYLERVGIQTLIALNEF